MTKGDYENLAAFRHELRRFLNFSEQAAQKAQLPPQQYLALLAIAGFPGRDYVTMGELAEQLMIVSHSAVELVNRLEEGNLVSRKRAEEDRRRVYISLTKQGRTRLKELARAHQTELQTVGPLLVRLLKQVAKPAQSPRA